MIFLFLGKLQVFLGGTKGGFFCLSMKAWKAKAKLFTQVLTESYNIYGQIPPKLSPAAVIWDLPF